MVHYYHSDDRFGAYAEGDLLCDIATGHVLRAVSDGRVIVLVPAEDVSMCDGCGEIVADIDAGFSPAVHGMAHECGGRWRRPATGDEIRPVTWLFHGYHGQTFCGTVHAIAGEQEDRE